MIMFVLPLGIIFPHCVRSPPPVLCYPFLEAIGDSERPLGSQYPVFCMVVACYIFSACWPLLIIMIDISCSTHVVVETLPDWSRTFTQGIHNFANEAKSHWFIPKVDR